MNLLNDNDKMLLNGLISSLQMFAYENGHVISHKPIEKATGSLYRFGWFYINGYKYSISGWKFKDGLVTFENEETGEKVKFSISDNSMKVGKFKKDKFIEKNVKLIRRKISKWLKDLSDKLQP